MNSSTEKDAQNLQKTKVCPSHTLLMCGLIVDVEDQSKQEDKKKKIKLERREPAKHISD